MAPIEGDRAPHVLRRHRRSLLRGTRPADVGDRGHGRVVNLPACLPEPQAQVDFLVVHKVRLVESADREDGLAAHRERSAEDPVDRARARTSRHSRQQRTQATLLQQDLERLGQPSRRQLRPSVRVDDQRSRDGGMRMLFELARKGRQAPVCGTRIRIEH